jgi:hypothetical protein
MFTNKDVADINRVIVEAGNPLTQTLAGRIQIAQDLMQGCSHQQRRVYDCSPNGPA